MQLGLKRDVTDRFPFVDYNLNDAASIVTSTTSSHIHRAYMPGTLQNVSTTSVAGKRHSNDGRQKKGKSASQAPRVIQPQHQNWFARFLRIKPAVSVVCFQISKVKARKEIARVFKEWRKYGIKDIVIDRDAARIWVRVAETNCKFRTFVVAPLTPRRITDPLCLKTALNIRPVSLAVEIFTILHHGRKANLSIARFTQDHGAKSSFGRVMEALESVLMARGFLVEEGTRRDDMTSVLDGVRV